MKKTNNNFNPVAQLQQYIAMRFLIPYWEAKTTGIV
ncbi:Protein of unknown function [Lactobacillus gigeriorum DSM 23908 = CRBIP 24.85]|uniref:Uncharacterized protein n=1 Tax=Lactobacillus gigeriorum DSM 23908 = CRBIP 24.85 TaxID=1423751 RepID=I7K1L9_9LACO|nr:Protein of unknown function [Lactobacillus gigeriorum DSM 23908 = CRBIP 24.85]